jgi:hypothetical protein
MRPTTGIASVLALAMTLPALALGAQDEEAVRRVFADYRAAILSGSGARAAALVSRSTVDYYEGLRQLALHGDEATVRARPPLDQVQILMFRVRVPGGTLEKMRARELIAHVVERGWMGKGSVRDVTPGPVEVQGDAAVLRAAAAGEDAIPLFALAREAGGWRLDLVPSAEASNASVREAAGRRGLPESLLVERLAASVLGRTLSADAWTPLRPASPPASH